MRHLYPLVVLLGLLLLTACGGSGLLPTDTTDTGAGGEAALTPVVAETATEEAVPPTEAPAATPLPSETAVPATATHEATPVPATATPELTQEATPMSDTTTQPSDTIPQEEGVIFIYEREGGFAGFCDTLTVYATEAQWVSCQGRTGTVPVDPATQDQLRQLVEQYQSFQVSGEDNPGGSDSMRQTVQFFGEGTAAQDEEVKITLQTIGSQLIGRAMQPLQ